MPFIFLLAISYVFAGDMPKYIYKQGDKKPFAGFELYNGEMPCKKPCLFIHKDSDSLRLILEGKKIRMAYKSKDKEQLLFPSNFRHISPQEKIETVSLYRDFFKSEFAVMLQAFINTVPGLFNWDIDAWRNIAINRIISENELYGIFNSGKKPQLYTILKMPCTNGESVVFESDGNGSFFMEIQ